MVWSEKGEQPVLGRPVVLSPEGKKVEPEAEKSFVQRYVLFLLLFGFALGGSVWVGVLTLRGRIGTGGYWLLGRFCCLREGESRSDRFGGLGGNWSCSFTVFRLVPLEFAAGEMCAVRCACLGCESWGLLLWLSADTFFYLGKPPASSRASCSSCLHTLSLPSALSLPPP